MFLLQIGLARHEAYNLAIAKDFDFRHYMEKRNNWLRNGLEETQVDNRLLYEIKSTLNERNSNNKTMHDASSSSLESYRNQNARDRPNWDRDDRTDVGFSANPCRDFSSTQQKMEVKRVDDDLFSRSCSPPKDLISIQEEYNYRAGNDDQYFKRSNEKNQYPSNTRPNERVYNYENSNEISGYQRERRRPIYDGFQRDDIHQVLRDVRSSSPPCGFNYMQQKKDDSTVMLNVKSLQSSTSPPSPPPIGFNSFKEFQLSRKRLNAIQCNTTLDRKASQNTANFVEPLNIMGSEPSSTTSLDYLNVSNSQVTQQSFDNPGDYTSLYKRTRDNNYQDSWNSVQGYSANASKLQGNQSHDYWTGADNSTHTMSTFRDNHQEGYSANASQMQGNQSHGYWTGAGNSTQKMSTFRDNHQERQSNIPPLVDNTKHLNNIPTLLSLPLNRPQNLPNEKRKIEIRQDLKEKHKLNTQLKNQTKRERTQRGQQDPYQKATSSNPHNPSGFKLPPVELSKANPQEYWSQWWPRYKYVEKSLQNKNLSLKSDDISPPPRKNLLLKIGINKILRNVDLSEKDYHIRDTFKLFKYKKQLENLNFQNSLEGFELKRVQAALAQLENRNTMALLHQSLIDKWHFNFDIVKRAQAGELIKSRNAVNLLSDQIFDYYVHESIQQLKEMCKAEWPQFEEFYNSIDTTNDETDTSTSIINNSTTTENMSMAKGAHAHKQSSPIDKQSNKSLGEVSHGARRKTGSFRRPTRVVRSDAVIPYTPSDPKEILRLLQYCNPKLPTRDWQIYKVADPQGYTRRVIIHLNEQSLAPLRETKGQIFYGFGTISLSKPVIVKQYMDL